MALLLLFSNSKLSKQKVEQEMVNMGENEWLNGYLEAILDVGSARNGKKDAESQGRSKKNSFNNGIRRKLDEEMLKFEKIEIEKHRLFTPTRYFVEEVINGFDEADLHRTWAKMIATRNSRHRNNRLENMCWRIWHLARRKKQIAWDAAQKLVQRRFDREKGRSDAAQDLSDLSEGERDKGESNQIGSITNMPRISSDTQLWLGDESRQLYIVLISLHGLVRGENMELGRDSDTGGQVKYVVELARALANMEGIHRVDVLTRQITSPEVDSTYSEPIEMLSCPSDGFGSCGAYVVRIPCGPSDKYIPKESLWPYIGEFVDGALSHIVNMARALGEQVNSGKPAWPYVIHGHYADAGDVAARLSAVLNVPMVLTGHSLGRNKLEQLLKQGRLSREDINTTYKIMRRIEAEEFGLDSAEMVVTSTKQEIEEQWGLYDGFDIQLERKLRIRRRRGVSCLGRYMPRMVVIQPGMDFSSVAEQLSLDSEGDLKSMIGADRKRPVPPIWSEIMRFFTNPHKPMILALSRPDPKKNITTLLKAFGECQPLQELANLTLILGNRDNIEEMSNSSSSVLTTVLKLVDKYDLYGQVAYPKHHKQPEVPEIYRLAAKTKGVFINPALVEPFGLTLIEAAAYGLPIVATRNGGPVDILKALNNGLLVDPHDEKAISDALLKLVADKNLWQDCRRNGLKNIHKFSWLEHCRNYLSHVEHCRNHHPTNHLSVMPIPEEPLSESLRGVEDLSLKFSIDVDVKANGEADAVASSQQKIIDVILQQKATSVGKSVNTYCPGRRQRLYVIAVDSYNSNGSPAEELPLIIKNVIQVSGLKCTGIGFVLLTGMSLQETKEMLGSEVKLEDFDALVCGSGSEMCYPWRDLVSDQDYDSHIEHRWPGENVKAIVTRLASVENDDVQLSRCGSRCYSYNIRPGAKVHKIDDLRQRLRMRGLRCNMVYTHAASRLNVIPLFASRAQALRYLSVRWSVEMEKVILFMGERGDTDYEDLLRGVHRSVILRDSVVYDSEINVHSKDDVSISQDNKRVALAEGFQVHDILKALDLFQNPI